MVTIDGGHIFYVFYKSNIRAHPRQNLSSTAIRTRGEASGATASELFTALPCLFRLRYDEDFLRLRVLHLASRRIATHIDISAVRLERAEHQTWFTRHR